MSSPPSKPESLRDRLRHGHFRKSSRDKSTTASSSASPARPTMKPTMSQTQILPPKPSRTQFSRPLLGPLQQETGTESGSSWKQRSSSLEFPERLKHGDDASEDVTEVHDPNLMNRSILNMISAAGATTEYHSRLDDISSDSEDDESTLNAGVGGGTATGFTDGAMSLPSLPKKSDSISAKSSKRSLLQSVHRLKLGSIRERHLKSKSEEVEDAMSSSQILMPPKRKEVEEPLMPPEEEEPLNRDAPYLSMLLKGEAEMHAQRRTGSSDSSVEASNIEDPIEETGVLGKTDSQDGTISLASRLMEIFDLKEPEEVIAEYPAWFLQTVLLSGYLYVTAKHICFYAYLPKNTKSASKSGYLGKRGQHNPHYKRYYVELKGDVLRYYNDPTNPYLPSGTIDLRYGISATIDPEKHKPKEESHYIKLVTKKREYLFRADSPQSARDWIKQLQRVMFRSNNDGDSVKILLPINNVIDMEANRFLEVSDTIKLRVIDNDETYAVDEVRIRWKIWRTQNTNHRLVLLLILWCGTRGRQGHQHNG
jgi:sterol 3beta-glucosyltransferase